MPALNDSQNGFNSDPDAHRDQHGTLGQRRQVLGFAVSVCVLAISGAGCHAKGEEGEDRRHQVGARMDGLGNEGEAARSEPGGQLDADKEKGCADGHHRDASR